MTYRKHLIWFGLLVASGCASAQPPVEQSKSQRLNFVDTSSNLRVFTDQIILGGDAFSNVKAHDVIYNFGCSGESYSLTFSTAPINRSALTTQLTNVVNAHKNLRPEKIKEINKDLSMAELVGPVGLRCPLGKTDEKVRITINIATKNTNTSIYDFSNKKYVLSPEDFEYKK